MLKHHLWRDYLSNRKSNHGMDHSWLRKCLLLRRLLKPCLRFAAPCRWHLLIGSWALLKRPGEDNHRPEPWLVECSGVLQWSAPCCQKRGDKLWEMSGFCLGRCSRAGGLWQQPKKNCGSAFQRGKAYHIAKLFPGRASSSSQTVKRFSKRA